MILQAWLTLPSCLASSNRPTLLRITFWSLVIVGSSPAVARRGDIAPPRRPAAHRFHLIRQIKSRLLQISRVPPYSPANHNQPPPSAPHNRPCWHGDPRCCFLLCRRSCARRRTFDYDRHGSYSDLHRIGVLRP